MHSALTSHTRSQVLNTISQQKNPLWGNPKPISDHRAVPPVSDITILLLKIIQDYVKRLQITHFELRTSAKLAHPFAFRRNVNGDECSRSLLNKSEKLFQFLPLSHSL